MFNSHNGILRSSLISLIHLNSEEVLVNKLNLLVYILFITKEVNVDFC